MAELMNNGVIKLVGCNGYFKPNSLLDPSWLKGKMTIEEYTYAINYINQCASHSQLGWAKKSNESEKVMRFNLRNQAAMATVQQLNEQFKSVHFTYEQTAEDITIYTNFNQKLLKFEAQWDQPVVVRASKSVLYIAVN